jgi:hypothetical protein
VRRENATYRAGDEQDQQVRTAAAPSGVTRRWYGIGFIGFAQRTGSSTLISRLIAAVLVLFLCWLLDETLARLAVADTPEEKLWNFDDAAPGTLPRAITVGTLFDGRPAGEWKVLITNRAKSASQVLAQLTSKGADQAYKLVLIDGTTSSNIDVEVSFLPVSGKADLGGGLIWRARDDRNYYLLRASAIEQNIRLYRVVKGARQLIKNYNRNIGQSWHTLRVIQQGCEMQIRYDDEPLFQLCESALDRGRIGLWTKSDAVTYFDDLQLHLAE